MSYKTRQEDAKVKDLPLNRIQRARVFFGITGARYLLRVMRGGPKVTVDRKDSAAKALVQIGFAGIPNIVNEAPQPTWLQEIIKGRAERLTIRQEVVIDRGTPIPIGEGHIPESLVPQGIQGELIRTDKADYVHKPIEMAQDRDTE